MYTNVTNRITIQNEKKIQLGKYVLSFISLNLNSYQEVQTIFDVYNDFIGYMNKQKISVLFETVYGSLSVKKLFLENRLVLLDKLNLKDSPYSYIEGDPITNSSLSCVNIIGIYDEEKVDIEYRNIFTSEKNDSAFVGSKSLGYDLVLLGDCVYSKDKYKNYNEYFAALKKGIDSNGLDYNDLIRTWFYLEDIYGDYEHFNLARNDFFKQCSIDISNKSENLPASTCIGGKSADYARATTQMLFFKCSDQVSRKRVFNRLQNEANGRDYLYSPAFARAALLRSEDEKIIFVSGTASVGQKGETMYREDVYNQIKRTVINLKELLLNNGFSFSDLTHVVCYFKSPESYDQYKKVLEELELDDFADAAVTGKVCREDLLFELDGIATTSSRRK